jgi:hypothetical protein
VRTDAVQSDVMGNKAVAEGTTLSDFHIRTVHLDIIKVFFLLFIHQLMHK